MELWDLYTENREPTGRTHVRGEVIPDGYYHLVVHVWIQNSKGEYLISQRAASRPTFPLMWECVGGSVLAGETSLEGALREIKEEVGLDLSPGSGRVILSKTRSSCNDIVDVWLFRYDGDVSLRNATTDEVAQVQWLTPVQVRELFDSGRLVESLSYFFPEMEPQTKTLNCQLRK